MEANGFVPQRTSLEAPGVDSRVSSAAAGAEFRWMGGRTMGTMGEFSRSISPRMAGSPDMAPVLYRVSADTLTPVEPEIDYEGLPRGVATSTHMLAGAVAGIMEHCLMYPIDCVKVCNQCDTQVNLEALKPSSKDKPTVSHWLRKLASLLGSHVGLSRSLSSTC